MSLHEIVLSTTPTAEAIAEQRLGDIVSLDGLMSTAREGVDMRALEARATLSMELPSESAANVHGSPAARINAVGSFDTGAVTATGSSNFAGWLPEWMEKTGARLIVGRGGMTSKDDKSCFVPNGAVCHSAVGYGNGAMLRRGVEKVEAVHWNRELGLAQAMWRLRCNRMGPFIAASVLNGDCLFERGNARIAPDIARAYGGTKPARLERYGKSNDRTDEVI